MAVAKLYKAQTGHQGPNPSLPKAIIYTSSSNTAMPGVKLYHEKEIAATGLHGPNETGPANKDGARSLQIGGKHVQ